MRTSTLLVGGFAALAVAQNSTGTTPAATSSAGGYSLPEGAGCGFNCMLRPLMYPRCRLLGTVLDALVEALAQKAGVNTKGTPGGGEAPHSHGGGSMGGGDMSMSMDSETEAHGHSDMATAPAAAAPAPHGHSDMEDMPMAMDDMAMDESMPHSHSKRQSIDVLVTAAGALAGEGATGILNQILNNINSTGSGAGLEFAPEVKKCLCTGTPGRKLKVAAEICVPKACAAHTAPLPIGAIYQGFVNYLCEGQEGWTDVPGALPIGTFINMAGGLKGVPAMLGSLSSMF